MATETTASDAKASARTEPKLLELLVCPLTKGPLKYDAEANELISFKARVAYPIRNGVPLMTAEAARPLDAPVPGAKAGGNPEAR